MIWQVNAADKEIQYLYIITLSILVTLTTKRRSSLLDYTTVLCLPDIFEPKPC